MTDIKASADQLFAPLDVATLKSALEASRAPLIITDNRLPDNPIIYTNRAFLELTGYEIGEVVGKNCRFLQGDDTDKQDVSSLRKAVKSGEALRVTIKNYRKDGSEFWNDLVVSPVQDASGHTTHFVGMQLDITERVRAEQRMQAKTHELEAVNEELEQFAYAASHDLQEPLRMISSYLQLVMRRYGDTFDEDATTFMGFATEGAERMQALINDLLTLSHVTTNEDNFKPIAMDRIIERALFNLKAAIDEHTVKIEVGNMPKLPVDAVQITQLFQNLIGNAIKYHRKGVTPSVSIQAEEHPNEYVFSVADNGIGIDKKHHDRVFQVFQRLHTRSEYEGTGIGLAICSKIVDRHGGKIWVESTVGKGSTFLFSIPIRERSTA